MVILYEHPLSPYSQKVKIALREKGVPFELRLPGGLGAGGAGGEFVHASPRAEVPALIDGDAEIFDSTIILEYVEEKWPEPALLPPTPADRARVRMIEEVMDTHFEAITWGLGELMWFKRASGALAERLTDNAGRQIEGHYRWLEARLGDAQWFNGASFGWGDLCVAPFVAGAMLWGFRPAAGGPLSFWFDRARSRPAVGQTIDEAARFDRAASNVAEMVEKGLFKREYRDHRLEWMIKSGGIEVVLKGLEADNIRFTGPFA